MSVVVCPRVELITCVKSGKPISIPNARSPLRYLVSAFVCVSVERVCVAFDNGELSAYFMYT